MIYLCLGQKVIICLVCICVVGLAIYGVYSLANKNKKADNTTSNNTNSWGGDGLYPMSSVGIIDVDSSRMILYEKGSFTTTPGGYRIMASKVANTEEGKNEQDGYVAFDLFIKKKCPLKYKK